MLRDLGYRVPGLGLLGSVQGLVQTHGLRVCLVMLLRQYGLAQEISVKLNPHGTFLT